LKIAWYGVCLINMMCVENYTKCETAACVMCNSRFKFPHTPIFNSPSSQYIWHCKTTDRYLLFTVKVVTSICFYKHSHVWLSFFSGAKFGWKNGELRTQLIFSKLTCYSYYQEMFQMNKLSWNWVNSPYQTGY
jgi:hypothetical protein